MFAESGDVSVLRLTRDFADDPFTSVRHPPPSYYAHISPPWDAQLQLCAPAVVKGGECKYDVASSPFRDSVSISISFGLHASRSF